jgi:SSS family solute:Na+ symporter
LGFPVLLVVPGLIGLALFHEDLGAPFLDQTGRPNDAWNGDSVLPRLMTELLPTGLMGLVVGAFLAGVLSNLDSYINAASTLVVTDLYRPLVQNANDRHYLFVGRALVVGFLLGGAIVSYFIVPNYASVFEAFQTFMTFFQGPLLALLLLGMLTKRTTQWGGLAGMLMGVGSAVVMHSVRFVFGPEHKIPYLWVAWWSFVAAAGTAILVSLCTRPYDKKRLAGLVCWIPAREETAE